MVFLPEWRLAPKVWSLILPQAGMTVSRDSVRICRESAKA
jgi:hypothetical protein